MYYAQDQSASQGYGLGITQTKSSRQMEYDIILRVTKDLVATWRQKDTNFKAFATSLTRNQKLWALLAMDVSGKRNALPEPLKAQILYLSKFVHHETNKVLQNNQDPGELIAVNRSILEGLKEPLGDT